ncbi:MAG: hypothetical protein FWH11_14810 [Micrococcales bacterium]|nr:hypothetical protein [Micrococcales bacterium]
MKTYLPVEPGGVATLDNSRPTFVPDRLDDLRGPTQGVVTLPLMLDWTPANTYDLSSEPRVRRLYETVLSEALSEDDVQTYVDKTTLTRLWHRLRLPRRVRVAWESTHPELAA